jgi:hypothetical protein
MHGRRKDGARGFCTSGKLGGDINVTRDRKYRIGTALLVGAVLLEAAMFASAKYNVPSMERKVIGTVQLDHCPYLQPGDLHGYAGDVHDFDIPAGRIEQTIRCFSIESGLEEGYTSDMQYVRTAAVKGRMTAFMALRQMLAPTNLVIVSPKPSDGAIKFGPKQQTEEGS